MRSIEELRDICFEIFDIMRRYDLTKNEVFLVLNCIKTAFKSAYEKCESEKIKGGDENERKS